MNHNSTTGRLKSGHFIVGSVARSGSHDDLSFSATPAKHNSLTSANAEAERLAVKRPDRKFVVVEVKGIVSASQFNWE